MKKPTLNVATCLQTDLTWVPYQAYNQCGRLAWYSKWVRLQPGETIAQAATRLSVEPPEQQDAPAGHCQAVPDLQRQLKADVPFSAH